MKTIITMTLTLVIFTSIAQAATLTETPVTIAQGNNVTAQWNGVVTPTNRDWIGLYAVGAGDTSYIDWIYDTTCSRAGNNSVLALGSCPFKIPTALPNGIYELRLYANNNYILLAKSNQFSVGPVRYVDNGDGTISDMLTGLMWEKKLPVDDVNCTDATNRSVHCLGFYTWSNGLFPPVTNDGTLFTNFLASLNAGLLGVSVDGITIVAPACFAGHCDWRIPNINELQTLRDCSSGFPCIDPIFAPMGTGPFGYTIQIWSSTSAPSPNLFLAWLYAPYSGGAGQDEKDFAYFSVAVRGGK